MSSAKTNAPVLTQYGDGPHRKMGATMLLTKTIMPAPPKHRIASSATTRTALPIRLCPPSVGLAYLLASQYT